MLKANLKSLAVLALACTPAWAQDLMPMRPMLQASPAQRPQFTFRVPVHLTSILQDTRAFINCRPMHSSTVMGELIQEVPLDADGNFNGTVVVAGSLTPDKDPTTVDNYGCLLRLQGPGESSPTTPCFGGSCPGWWNFKPGTIFRPSVGGPLPR